MRRRAGVTHVVGIDIRVVEPIGPVDDAIGLSLDQVLVCSAVDVADIVAAKDECLNGPVAVLNVEYLDRGRCDDAKVVTGTLQGPEEIRFAVNGLEAAVS